MGRATTVVPPVVARQRLRADNTEVLERSGELHALGAAARSAAQGAGSVALVHGEAGIGK